jgi:hypothetical protein
MATLLIFVLLTATYVAEEHYIVEEIRYRSLRIADEIKTQKQKERALILGSSLTIEGTHCYISMATLLMILYC